MMGNEILNPVAISGKELSSATSVTIQTFEMCTMCGARFGIGYRGHVTMMNATHPKWKNGREG